MEIARLIGIPFALRAYRFLRSASIFSSQYRLPSPGIRRDLRELAGTSRDGADCDFIGVGMPRVIRRVGRGSAKMPLHDGQKGEERRKWLVRGGGARWLIRNMWPESFSLTMAMCATAEAADLGKFTRPASDTTVDFYDCGGNLCGKIVSVDDKSDTETLGKLIVDGAKPAGNGIWKGELIDVESGKRIRRHHNLERQRVEAGGVCHGHSLQQRDLAARSGTDEVPLN